MRWRQWLSAIMNAGCRAILCLVVLWAAATEAHAAGKSIRVFVALCDNATQGIIPVPPKIGNGNDLDNNLYWSCDEGLRRVFQNSSRWQLTSGRRTDKAGDELVMDELEFTHKASKARLVASAYRGSQMQQCLRDFESAIRAGEHDLVVFIGHNGLMDAQLPVVAASPARKADVIVLCCKSADYFRDRITAQGGRPVLLTTQLMYPGAFILRDAAEAWLGSGNTEALRTAAAQAYAKNQGISVKAARGVFLDLTTPK